jgi:hypothetical protein
MSRGPLPGGGARRHRRGTALLLLAAAGLLAAAASAGIGARAVLTRTPTAAQRSAAAAAAVAQRWRAWPAGRIFPATLGYTTDLLSTETATRLGISRQAGCASAIAPGLTRLARHDHCLAGLRASYLDQLQGIVYTVGVLAFPDARLATAFAGRLPGAATATLRPLALPGTASARFGAAARQAGTARHAGPFVVLTTSGYADGEPAGAGQQRRPGIFAPAGQLSAEIIRPLTQPVTVHCGSPEWSC